jgi:hypothetical protein
MRGKEESDYRLAALQEKLARIEESQSQQLSMSRNRDDDSGAPLPLHINTHNEAPAHSSQKVCV